MSRTALRDRILPNYTKGEEIFNMVSHIVGGALGVAALALCVVFSFIKGDAYAVVSSFIYGFSIVILYTVSSIYHGITPKADIAKKVMQIIDHCVIFVLIAGTYTPVCLIVLGNAVNFRKTVRKLFNSSFTVLVYFLGDSHLFI